MALQQLIKKRNYQLPLPTPTQFIYSSFSIVGKFQDAACRSQSTEEEAPTQRQFILGYCK
jgi:hypothetical protein